MVNPMYTGRFAPSPSGPLHFGSLVTAVASYLDARQHHGRWLIRIEDVDGTRCHASHADHIIRTLASYGMESDDPIWFQSDRTPRYESALHTLMHLSLIYPCNCTRAMLTSTEGRHSNPCTSSTSKPHSWRMRCQDRQFSFEDGVQGKVNLSLQQPANQPILKRKDGYFSYQLAVVVDDHDQQITHIVRGADLLDTTAQQLWLYDAFGWQAPKLTHLPLILGENGLKLSKQNHAKPIPDGDIDVLKAVLRCLNIPCDNIPCNNVENNISILLTHAITKWNPASLPKEALSLNPNDLTLIR